MFAFLKTSFVGAGLLVAVSALAQVPAGAPEGSTAVCKDGSFHFGDRKADACVGHEGVQQWWGRAVAGHDVPGAGAREPYDKAQHPTPAVAPAESGRK